VEEKISMEVTINVILFLGGGNGHAMEHFSNTKHSLVVKLGTITPEGGASVHCYTCGDEVIDNFL
jgi:ubiquitin carboxyl-terminal hydrolase 5/13